MSSTTTKVSKFLLVVIATVVLLLGVAWYFKAQPEAMQQVNLFVAYLKFHPLIFALILIAITTVMLPPFALVILGGFLYGAIKGTVISCIAYVIGATASFLISRYFGQEVINRISEKRPSFSALNLAVERKGFLMVLLTRLAMVVPYNLLYVVLGVSKVPLKHYVVGTLFGILPVMAINSFVGETAPNLIDILQGNVKSDMNGLWVVGFGIVMIAILILVVRWSAKQLQQELDQ